MSKPRRCSKRWLDGDCPKEILCILDHPRERERFDVFYADAYAADAPFGPWVGFVCSTEDGAYYHGEMPAHEVAAYRYRFKHRYARWSDLPDAVKAVVRRDIEMMNND